MVGHGSRRSKIVAPNDLAVILFKRRLSYNWIQRMGFWQGHTLSMGWTSPVVGRSDNCLCPWLCTRLEDALADGIRRVGMCSKASFVVCFLLLEEGRCMLLSLHPRPRCLFLGGCRWDWILFSSAALGVIHVDNASGLVGLCQVLTNILEHLFKNNGVKGPIIISCVRRKVYFNSGWRNEALH